MRNDIKINILFVFGVFLSLLFLTFFIIYSVNIRTLREQVHTNGYDITEIKSSFQDIQKEFESEKYNSSIIELVPVVVTAYNPVSSQTDDSPTITASNKKVKEGMIALSRDIEKEFGFKFGDEVYLLDYGRFVFQDRMHERWKNRVDILMFSEKAAKEFGIKSSFLVVEK